MLLSKSISALECKPDVFNPAINAINQAVDELAKSSTTPKILKSLKTVHVSKKNYKEDMKILNEKLLLLLDRKKHALHAKEINEKNLKVWISLEKNCIGQDKFAAKKVKNDVISLGADIEQRLKTIEHYINLTKMGLDIGKKKYSN
jgi:hypothetical protein